MAAMATAITIFVATSMTTMTDHNLLDHKADSPKGNPPLLSKGAVRSRETAQLYFRVYVISITFHSLPPW